MEEEVSRNVMEAPSGAIEPALYPACCVAATVLGASAAKGKTCFDNAGRGD
jgi:hypothetical protein